MPKYEVRICRSYIFSGYVEVEAKTPASAEKKARKLIDDTELKMDEIDEGRDYIEVTRRIDGNNNDTL
jgi:hypothetical protein